MTTFFMFRMSLLRSLRVHQFNYDIWLLCSHRYLTNSVEVQRYKIQGSRLRELHGSDINYSSLH